jgi:hypothetical protein
MGFLKTNDKPDYTGLRLNSSVSYLPIPIVIGWARLAGNLVWAGDYQQAAGTTGKGGALGKGSGQQQYTASLLAMCCEGPVQVAPNHFMWVNSNWTTSNQFGGIVVYHGYQTAPWAYMEAAHPTQALTYPGMCYFAVANTALGDSQSLPNITMLVPGVLAYTGPNANRKVTLIANENSSSSEEYTIPVADADPALAAQALLTGHDWSLPDFPAGSIDTVSWFASSAAFNPAIGDASWQAWTKANGIGFSVFLDSAEPCTGIMERLFQLSVTAPVWSGDRLKAIPYGDSQVTANGYTYTPPTAPVYALNGDDFVVTDANTDPLVMDRKDISSSTDLPNCLRMTWKNAANVFNDETIEAKDQGQIQEYGLHVGPTVDAKEITYAATAQTVSTLLLNRGLYIRNTFRFTLPAAFWALDPMDLVSLTWAPLGLSAVTVRVTEIQSDDKGNLSVTAEEYPAGVATAVLYPVQTIVSSPNNTNQPPDSVNAPIIFEPGPLLSGGSPQVWVAVSGGAGGLADPNWGGCDVYASIDGVEYEEIGTVTGPARMGVTTATLAAYAGGNPDTIDTLSVCLAESNGVLNSTSAAAAAQAQTLCYVAGELVSYESAIPGTGAQNVSETDAVPASSPYTVTVSQSAEWLGDLGVTAGFGPIAAAMAAGSSIDMGLVASAELALDDFGSLTDVPVSLINLGLITDPIGTPGTGTAAGSYSAVSGTPAAGQYSVASGVYTFNAANAGDLVTIAYSATADTYALNPLWRGLYGTTPAAHAAGVPFARFDSAIFKYTLPTGFIGETLYLKFASFNIWGNATQDLSVVEPYVYTPGGAGWLGPVASAMALGTSIDMGSITGTPIIQDNFGSLTASGIAIDLGMLAA